MIKEITNIIGRKQTPFVLKNTKEENIEIQKYWSEFLKTHPSCFNGDIVVVQTYQEENNQLYLTLASMHYADYIYSLKNDFLTIFPLFVSGLFKTKDGFYTLIRNQNKMLNTLGGTVDLSDFDGDLLNPFKCLKRELKEEVNLNIEDSKQVLSVQQKYFKFPNTIQNDYSYGILYTGILNFTREELIEHYEKSKKVIDHEVGRLVFYNKDNISLLELPLPYNNYILELLEKEVN